MILDCDPEILYFWSFGREKEWRGKRRKTLCKENIWKANEMKNGEKKEEIFVEGRYSFCGGEEEWTGKMRNVLREGKYFFL